MTRYIQWGERRGTPSGATHYGFGGSCEVDPTDLSTAQALWSALPPDLRLALAKTAPKVVDEPWQQGTRCLSYRFKTAYIDHDFSWRLYGGDARGKAHSLAEAQSACDAALLAQGYVLDGDTP